MADPITSIRPLAAVLVSAVAVVLIIASYRYPNVRESWSVAAALAKFGIILSMLPGVLSGETYEWSLAAATGVEFIDGIDFALEADPLGMLFALLASFLWIFTSFYATGYMRGLDEHSQTRFFAAFAASLSTAVGIAFSANLVTIFVFYELLSLVTYPLVAHNGDAEARIAGRKYLAYTFFGGGVCLLAGTVMIYWLTSGVGDPTVAFQSGGMDAVASAASDDSAKVYAQAAFFLLIAGFGVKAAIMPLHSWLADAMVAPTPVSGLLHAVAVVKSGAFGIARVILEVYGVETIRNLPLSVPGVGEVGLNIPVAILATFTLLAASIIALRKDHLKRRLAYSTTAQLSYIVLGLSMLHPYAILGALFHIPAHAFGKLTLFFCAGSVHVETHTDYISEMAGIGKRMPLTMTAFAIGSAGMAGIPLAAGFVSKFYMLIGGMNANYWPFALALIISGVLNIVYLWPVVYTAFFESEDRHDAKPLLEFPPGGKRDAVGETDAEHDVATDGGDRENDDGTDDGFAVDEYPSDADVPFGPSTNGSPDGTRDGSDDTDHAMTAHDDDHGHHHGGAPPGGWERRTPFDESTWLMLLPIAVIATGGIVLGVVPDLAVFLELASEVVQVVTGVSVP